MSFLEAENKKQYSSENNIHLIKEIHARRTMRKSYDVIIAGAGPVGLLLACELALTGVSVLILERETATTSPWKNGIFALRGLSVPSVEAFYRRGLLGQVFEGEKRPTYYEKKEDFQVGGHFAGMKFNANQIDFSRWPYWLSGPSFMPGPSSLGRIEVVLSEHAQALGVEVLRGKEVTGLADEREIVKVWAGDYDLFTGRWLVGCDGGRSKVRKAAGFQFEGTDAEFTGYVVECDLDKPELLGTGFCRTGTGMYINSGQGRLHVIDCDTSFDRSQPVTREHFETVLQRVSETAVGVKTIHLSSTFTDRSKQATKYRQGRVLLAGDSAHIHSPLGAQGLNTGLGDAFNLGWKLAATIKGTASPGLLDTYHQERHPIAARVLEWTRAQVISLRPDPYGRALTHLLRDVINTNDVTTYLAGRAWGLGRLYELGDSHPLVGCSAPDFEFEDGSRLGNKLENGCFMVVAFEGQPELAELAQSMRPMVNYSGSPAKETFALRALLVRPDGIVVWVSEKEPELDGLKAALSCWLSLPGQSS